ncbi:MAG: trypsin-like peptidase domain-containing protein [Proteobacteria bacterium]|nr:trypsin-like peptidase domain-containing protein [Cystobacterineae bacterium]MCL2313724.1 trypsin-like peptidase domain-containing protein [Pseudomonadota bacterium]
MYAALWLVGCLGFTFPSWAQTPRVGAQTPPALPRFIPPPSLAPLVRAVRATVVSIRAENRDGTRSLGSGLVVSKQGEVLTNAHVVSKALHIRVRLSNGEEYSAQPVGQDGGLDLALLQLGGGVGGGLAEAYWGDSDVLEIGDWVVAIGQPFGLEATVTHGLVSARERVLGIGPLDDFIQISAPINPGNSGGPLFNMKAEVVGLTTARIDAAQGISFAVPINFVREILPRLQADERIEAGWLGAVLKEAKHSLWAMDVYQSSPAALAGLLPGDEILSVGGKPVESYFRLLRRIALLPPGSKVALSVRRQGELLELSAQLSARPAANKVLHSIQGSMQVPQLAVVLSDVPVEMLKKLKLKGGALVTSLSSPQEKNPFHIGDILLEMDNRPFADTRELGELLAKHKKASLKLLLLRNDKRLSLTAHFR